MGKDNETNGLGLGEISTIRQILMGQQISEFEQRFAETQERMKAMDQLFEKKLAQMETQFQRRVDEMEQDFLRRLEDLQNLLETHVADLENQLAHTSRTDKASLGQMLQDIGQKLKGGE